MLKVQLLELGTLLRNRNDQLPWRRAASITQRAGYLALRRVNKHRACRQCRRRGERIRSDFRDCRYRVNLLSCWRDIQGYDSHAGSSRKPAGSDPGACRRAPTERQKERADADLAIPHWRLLLPNPRSDRSADINIRTTTPTLASEAGQLPSTSGVFQ